MEAIRKDGVIYLHQSKYAMKLLLRFQLSEAKESPTLVTLRSKLKKERRRNIRRSDTLQENDQMLSIFKNGMPRFLLHY